MGRFADPSPDFRSTDLQFDDTNIGVGLPKPILGVRMGRKFGRASK